MGGGDGWRARCRGAAHGPTSCCCAPSTTSARPAERRRRRAARAWRPRWSTCSAASTSSSTAPMPYMLWIHQRPTDGGDVARGPCSTCTSPRCCGPPAPPATSPPASWAAACSSTRSRPRRLRRRLRDAAGQRHDRGHRSRARPGQPDRRPHRLHRRPGPPDGHRPRHRRSTGSRGGAVGAAPVRDRADEPAVVPLDVDDPALVAPGVGPLRGRRRRRAAARRRRHRRRHDRRCPSAPACRRAPRSRWRWRWPSASRAAARARARLPAGRAARVAACPAGSWTSWRRPPAWPATRC